MKIEKSQALVPLLGILVCGNLLMAPTVTCSASLAEHKSTTANKETKKKDSGAGRTPEPESPKQESSKKEIAEAQMPVYEPGQKLPKGMAESSVSIIIAAEQANVWKTLTNFETYPDIFKRIKTSEITRREGDLVFLETYLKPQMFVKNQVQHTVSNIAAAPNHLNWKQLDGNFKHVDGSWDLASAGGGKTKLTYTLHVDAGPIVPPSLVSFFLKFVQKEVVSQVKLYVEKEEKKREPHDASRAKN